MSKPSFQDRHLDMLIRFAFEQIEEEEINALIQSNDPELNAEQSERMKRCYQKAVQITEHAHRQAAHHARRKGIKQALKTAAVGFAALLVIALIALPVAFAVSSEFRTSVLKLFVQIDTSANEEHFSFRPVTENQAEGIELGKAAEIPREWKGKYYPYDLPEDMKVSYISENGGNNIELEGAQERKIAFSEYDSSTSMVAGIEGAVIDQVVLSNGETAIVNEGDVSKIHVVSITWAVEEKWFDLTAYNFSREQAIRITNSVRAVDEP